MLVEKEGLGLRGCVCHNIYELISYLGVFQKEGNKIGYIFSDLSTLSQSSGIFVILVLGSGTLKMDSFTAKAIENGPILKHTIYPSSLI